MWGSDEENELRAAVAAARTVHIQEIEASDEEDLVGLFSAHQLKVGGC